MASELTPEVLDDVQSWIADVNAKPPELAFTAGPKRVVADLLWPLKRRLAECEAALRDIPGGWIGRMAATLTRCESDPESGDQRRLQAWLDRRAAALSTQGAADAAS